MSGTGAKDVITENSPDSGTTLPDSGKGAPVHKGGEAEIEKLDGGEATQGNSKQGPESQPLSFNPCI